MARLWIVLAAFVRRRWLEETVRWSPLVLSTAAFVGGLLSQAFLGRMVDAAPNRALGSYEGHYAAFLLLGVVLLDLQNTLAGGLSARIREAQVAGTLETMLATPTPTGSLLVGLVLPDLVWAVGRVLSYAALGVILFGVRLGDANLPAVLLVTLLAMTAFGALALVSSALTMLLRRANPLSLFVASTSLIAGGVIYPRGILPVWLAWLGAALPIAPALDGVRAAMVHGTGIAALAEPLARLSGFTLLVGPLGVWLFVRALARARADGSLTSY